MSGSVIVERYVVAGTLICGATMAAILWIPSMLGLLHDGYAMDAGQLGRVAFGEKAGLLIATTLASSQSIPVLRRWMLIGCTLLGVANCTLVFVASHASFVPMRFIAGLGSGVGYAFALKLCSVSARPTRSFGILTSAMSLLMIVGYQVVAALIETHGMQSGFVHAERIRDIAGMLYGVFAVLAALAAALVLAIPVSSQSAREGVVVIAHGMPKPLVLIGLGAVVLSMTAFASCWPFLQTLGVSHGFPVSGVANAMSINAIMGVVGGLTAAALPVATRRWMPMSAALVVLWGGLVALYAPASLGWYVAGCAIGGFYWGFILPLMLGLLARIDQTGRGPVLGGTMSSVGGALGPLVAGLLVQGTNYEPVGWLAGMLCTAGLICVIVMETRGSRAAAVPQPSRKPA